MEHTNVVTRQAYIWRRSYRIGVQPLFRKGILSGPYQPIFKGRAVLVENPTGTLGTLISCAKAAIKQWLRLPPTSPPLAPASRRASYLQHTFPLCTSSSLAQATEGERGHCSPSQANEAEHWPSSSSLVQAGRACREPGVSGFLGPDSPNPISVPRVHS